MTMGFLRLFSSRNSTTAAATPTASVARERLQILLAHERGLLGQPDLLVRLRELTGATEQAKEAAGRDAVVRAGGVRAGTFEVDGGQHADKSARCATR